MAEWVSGLADPLVMNTVHLIRGLTILIHHTGFIVNRQLEIWAQTMTEQSLSVLSATFGASLNIYKIFSFPNHPLSVGLSLSSFYWCWWQSFQVQSSTTFQKPLPVKVESGGKAVLLHLWVDTWVNGMCTAGKMILLQTAVWIREVSLTPPTQKQ